MNKILVYLAILIVSGVGLTRAMAVVNPFERLDVIALLQWYQSYYPNASVPAHLLQPKQQRPAGQPQTSRRQGPPTAPSVPAPAPAPAPAPQFQSKSATAPERQFQTLSAPASTPRPQPEPQTPPPPPPSQPNPSIQLNHIPSHYPVPTEHINMHQGRGMQNMPNVDPVTQMLLMAARMKRKYRRGEPLPRMPPFFPGGWVIAADGSDASVLGKDGRTYTIDSNRICIARRCARVL